MTTDIVMGPVEIELIGEQLILKRNADDAHPVRFQLKDGNLILGGNGRDGDLMMTDRAGNLTIGLNGESGSLHLGGRTEDGDIILRDRQGRKTLRMDGALGGIKADGDVEVGGDLRVDGRTIGASAFEVDSDAALKTDVLPIEAALDRIAELRGVSYRRKDDPATPHLGFVAQEVAEHVPEAVRRNEATGLHSLDVFALVPVLLEAVKSLKSQVADQEVRIAALEAKQDRTP